MFPAILVGPLFDLARPVVDGRLLGSNPGPILLKQLSLKVELPLIDELLTVVCGRFGLSAQNLVDVTDSLLLFHAGCVLNLLSQLVGINFHVVPQGFLALFDRS